MLYFHYDPLFDSVTLWNITTGWWFVSTLFLFSFSLSSLMLLCTLIAYKRFPLRSYLCALPFFISIPITIQFISTSAFYYLYQFFSFLIYRFVFWVCLLSDNSSGLTISPSPLSLHFDHLLSVSFPLLPHLESVYSINACRENFLQVYEIFYFIILLDQFCPKLKAHFDHFILFIFHSKNIEFL